MHPEGAAGGHLENSSNHLEVNNQVARAHESVLVVKGFVNSAVALTTYEHCSLLNTGSLVKHLYTKRTEHGLGSVLDDGLQALGTHAHM